MNPDAKYWVALSTHNKIGARTFGKLYKRFKKLANLWQKISKQELAQAGLDLAQIDAVLDVILKKDPDQELAKVKKLGLDIFGFEYSDSVDCIVCYDKTYTKTSCSHSLCVECWSNLRKYECPLCRNFLSMRDEDDDN